MRKKSALFIVLLLPAVLLAGCGQATFKEAAISLQSAVAEINAQQTTQSVVSEAIVLKVVPSLINEGAIEYSWLGITGTTLTADLAEAMDLGRDQRGALVIEVTDNSPAGRAGLRGSGRQVDLDGEQVDVGGDVIIAIESQPVSEFDDLVSYLVGSTSVGDEVTLTILRDGLEQMVEVTLAARPDIQQ